MLSMYLKVVLIGFALVVGLGCSHASQNAETPFPRIGNLWGLNITGKISYVGAEPTFSSQEYDQWSKYDLLISAGGSENYWKNLSAELRRRNPHIVLLRTEALTNIHGGTPWMEDEWYLRLADGTQLRWWAGQIRIPNITIDDCLSGVVGAIDAEAGSLLSAGYIDGLFFDSVASDPTYFGTIDANMDGKADLSSEIGPLWRHRQDVIFEKLRKMHPGMVIMCNGTDRTHGPRINGNLIEGQVLLDMINTGSMSASDVIRTVSAWYSGSAKPATVLAIMNGPHGMQDWRNGKVTECNSPGEVDLVQRDFTRMRVGLVTTLMTDACYAYDVGGSSTYGYTFWYPEYDAPLGKAMGPARQMNLEDRRPVTIIDWKAGSPLKSIEVTNASVESNGIILRSADPKFTGTFVRTDPGRIRFQPGAAYRITADVKMLDDSTPNFMLKLCTPSGGAYHDKAVTMCWQEFVVGKGDFFEGEWLIDKTADLDDFSDYRLELSLTGKGDALLQKLKVERINRSYWVREFEGGLAILNPGSRTITVKLAQPMWRLKDDQSPKYAQQVLNTQKGFKTEGEWQRKSGEAHYLVNDYADTDKPGQTASWEFKASHADEYTFFANCPGGKDFTDAAVYTLEGIPSAPSITIDQRTGDGGWLKLFSVKLQKDQTCSLTVHSGKNGHTAADAARMESAVRYNDGARIKEVVLDPRDGVILLKKPMP